MRLQWQRGRERIAWALSRSGETDRLVQARRIPHGIAVAPVSGAAGRRARTVTGIVQDVSLRHERLDLPPMPANLVERAVRQHCLTVQSGDDEMELGYVADSASPNDVLVVWAQRRAVNSTVESLTSRGLRVKRLLSNGTALCGLLKAAARSEFSEGSSVLVHVGENVVSVISCDNGCVALGREFALAASQAADVREESGQWAARTGDHNDQIVEEIGRSILLFNHRLRGQRAKRILISSDGSPLATLINACQTRFGLPVSMLVEAVDLDLSAFGADSESRDPWILSIAAAVTDLNCDPDINLLPEIMLRAQRRRAANTVMATAAGFVLVIMIGQHAFYLTTARALARDLRSQSILVAETDRVVGDLSALREARQTALVRSNFIADRLAPAAVACQLLARLSASATPNLCLDELEIQPAGTSDSLAAVARGRIVAADVAAAQKEFRLFHDQLFTPGVFHDVHVGPLLIEPEGGGSVLRFEMTATAIAKGEDR